MIQHIHWEVILEVFQDLIVRVVASAIQVINERLIVHGDVRNIYLEM